MMTRPQFMSPTTEDIIRTIRTPDTTFYIDQDENDDLFLEVCPSEYETFRFHMSYAPDIASGVNRYVEYENGYILFTDDIYDWASVPDVEVDFDTNENNFTSILETDYTIPMIEDVEECPVCYEQYEPMYGSLCGHRACLDCMRRMDATGLTKCPMCRSDDFKFPIAVACNKMFVTV
jgi:hypothetical protein